jgi:hypothetical protein
MAGWTLATWLGVSALAGAQESTPPGDGPAVGFQGYPGAPALTVVPRQDQIRFFPCEQCHKFLETDPQVRQLTAPHVKELDHGAGRIWCLNCHDGEDRNFLVTLRGDRVEFNDSYLVCGGCHASRQRDWYFGAHGKRVGNWRGERTVYGCAHCHDPHQPALKPRAPMPPPPVRKGLSRPDSEDQAPELPWETRDEVSP